MPEASRPDFVLDEQLCFALHTASRAMTGCYRPLLDGIGLTYSQYAVMLVLWEQDSIPLGSLCARCSSTPAPCRRCSNGSRPRACSCGADGPRTSGRCSSRSPSAGGSWRGEAAAIQARVQVATGLAPAELARLRDDLHALAARLRAAHLVPEAV